jgi:nucleoside phosphorylase
MLLLIFALPEEARAVRRRIRWTAPEAGIPRGTFAGQDVSLGFVGIGGAGISKVERTMELIQPGMVISSGFAGATRSLLEAGDFVLSTNYTDPEIGKLLNQKKIADATGPFVQVGKVASGSDKWSLNRSLGSVVVDMESAMIANLCQKKQLPLVTARMISDAIDESIPAIFVGKKISRVGEVGDAAIFAGRMLGLIGKLADRLEVLVAAVAAIPGRGDAL